MKSPCIFNYGQKIIRTFFLLITSVMVFPVFILAQCQGPVGQDSTKWTRTFTEEFNGNSLDMNVWNNAIWYQQSDPVINYAVENGVLKIWPDQGFKDRTIDTDGKYTQTYGYFEARMKLNVGKGVWPAFWLYAHPNNDRPEIDIMEAYPGGGPSSGWGDANLHPITYAMTLHKANANYSWHEVPFSIKYTDFRPALDFSAAFHVYGVNWEPDRITFYIDGQQIGPSHNYSDNYWNKPMYILLDLWFGSASGTPNTSQTPMGKSNSFEIDYVRAWQSGTCTGTPPPPPPPPTTVCSPQLSPVIDGIAENTWTSINADTLKNAQNLSGTISSPADLSANYKATWDNTGLYLLVQVNDDVLINDSANPWEDDAVEVFIDGNNDKASGYDANDHQYIFRVNDPTVYHYRNAVAQPVNPAGVTFSQGSYSGGYLMEIKIEWSVLGVTPSNGKLVGLDMHVDDDDDGGAADAKVMWATQAGQKPAIDPSVLGTIKLENTSCNITTGLAINEEGNMTMIFPSPAREFVTLLFQNPLSEVTSIEIVNIMGQKIYTGNLQAGTLSKQINLRSVPPGIYFLKIRNGDQLQIQKFIKE